MDCVSDIIELQRHLYSLSASNLEHTLQYIRGSVFVTTEENLQRLAYYIGNCVKYRPQLAHVMVELLAQINSQVINSWGLEFCFNPTFSRESFMERVPLVYFLRLCYQKGIFSFDDIFNEILRFGMRYHEDGNTLLLFFCWFAPEIEENDITYFNEVNAMFEDKKTLLIFPQCFHHFFRNLPMYAVDEWKLFHEIIELGYDPNTVEYFLSIDDVDHFQSLVTTPGYSLNTIIPPSIFERHIILQKETTLIQFSAFHCSEKCFRYLMINGATMETLVYQSLPLSNYAIAGGSLIFIRLAEQNSCHFMGALQIAAEYHKHDLFEWVFQNKSNELDDNEYGSVLHKCVKADNFETFRFLFDRGIDINHKNRKKQSLLFVSCVGYHFDFAKFLLSQPKIDVNSYAREKITPLNGACKVGFKEGVELLLKCENIDVNFPEKKERSPLINAAKHGHFDIVYLLISQPSIDVNMKDKNNMTALHFAALNNNPELLLLLLNVSSIDINSEDMNGRTPLHVASKEGNIDNVKLLLARKEINVNACGYDKTPLIDAVSGGNAEITKLLLNDPRIDVNATDRFKRTALHFAAQRGDEIIIKTLLDMKDIKSNVRDVSYNFIEIMLLFFK